MTFLPHDGTYFDDQRADDVRDKARRADPRSQDPNTVALLSHLAQNPSAVIQVSSVSEREEMHKNIILWMGRGFLLHEPKVRVNPNIARGKLVV